MEAREKIMAVLVLLLMLSIRVSAIFDIMALIIADLGADFVSVMIKIGVDIVKKFIFTLFVKSAVINSLKEALQWDAFKAILTCNPELIDIGGVANPIIANKVNFFIHLLAPFYLLAFLFLALYLLFVSGSSEGRARAKGSMLRLVLSVAFVLLTIPIVQAFLDISAYLIDVIISYSQGNMEIALGALENSLYHIWESSPRLGWTLIFAFWLGLPLLMFIMIIAGLPFVIIGLRYFMIILWTLMFPFAIFLYSMHFTRRVGGQMIRQLIYWTFITPLMAIILAVIGIAAGPLLTLVPDTTMETCLGLAGFLVLGAAPLMMVGIMNMMQVIVVAFAPIETDVMDMLGI